VGLQSLVSLKTHSFLFIFLLFLLSSLRFLLLSLSTSYFLFSLVANSLDTYSEPSPLEGTGFHSLFYFGRYLL
jgi:hypothetical protein